MDLSGAKIEVKKKEKPPVYPTQPCKRCGRTGHFSFVCYVKRDVQGKPLESDSEYDSDGHS